MTMKGTQTTFNLFAISIVLLLALAALSEANIADFDETWQKRAEYAREQAHAAYDPDPLAATNNFNAEVQSMDSKRGRMAQEAVKDEGLGGASERFPDQDEIDMIE